MFWLNRITDSNSANISFTYIKKKMLQNEDIEYKRKTKTNIACKEI